MKKIGATRQLAAFVDQTQYEDLPQPVLVKAKEIITDQLGVALASSMLPWNRKFSNMSRPGYQRSFAVIGTGYRSSIEYAALVNGTLATDSN